MSANHRPARFLAYAVATIASALLLTSYAWDRQTQARSAASRAAEDLAACRKLAEAVRSFKELPAKAGVRDVARSELDHELEDAAKAAGMAPDRLVSITPAPPHRVGGSVYEEKPTEIVLKGVTVQELMIFLYELSEKNAGLRVESIRLASPRQNDTAGRWSAQATLSYLIYSPKSDTQSPRGEP